MVTRRDICLMGLVAPWLAACGGGGDSTSAAPMKSDEQVIRTTIPADDWATATPDSQRIPGALMQSLLNDAATLAQLRSLLVVRNGLLIGERYYADGLSSDLRHIRSVTKTVSSLLIGQAIGDEKISGVAANLTTLLPKELAQAPSSKAGNITLEQILQMRTGQIWDDWDHTPAMFDTPNLTALALNAPLGLPAPPPWNYNSASSHLCSPILTQAYGMSALELATRKLFQPLGIKQVAWSHDSTGNNHGSFGLQMRTRDLMKLAWMSLDAGQWQGRSVVPASWLSQSLHGVGKLGDERAFKDIGYGYLWWTGVLGGQNVALAWGFGGQFAILVPGLNMTIATAMQWHLPSAEGSSNAIALLSVLARFLQAAP